MLNEFILLPGYIVTANENNDVLKNKAVLVQDGRIAGLLTVDEARNKNIPIIERPGMVLIPGFIQTHVHLCQTLFRGLADDLELLDWLKDRIFPYENSHSSQSLRASAKLGISELIKSGTTTLLDMGTIRHQEVIFEELIASGIRGFAGKCMVDRNELYPQFVEKTKDSLNESYKLAKEFHNSGDGRIKYGFAPRFVLSCSEELMTETFSMLNEFDQSLFHTHSSENKSEIETVRRMTGKENIEYFDSIGILSDRTILAHGIHVNDNEVEMLKERDGRIVHCPSSNLKLASGIADIPKYIEEGISVSLGADGAPCNNNLSMFTEMRLASLIQKPIHGPTSMDSLTTFRLATIEGAKALHMENEIGSIEVGKKADLVVLNLNKVNQPVILNENNIYSSIVYSASQENVNDVFVDGKQLVENGVNLIYEEDEVIAEANLELKKLLERVN